MNYQKVFMRYEIKYIINKQQRRLIEDAFSGHMQLDKYGKSTICNIYFDTPDKRLIRRSIEKPVYKEKLRIRSYGITSHDSIIFVELKKKYNDIVYKRRVCMSVVTAEKYLHDKILPEKPGQIINEIDYFMFFYPKIEPAIYIAYERAAFIATDDSDFRITFDENILWRDMDLSLTSGIYGQSLLDGENILMEIKTAFALPLWLTHTLTENRIITTPFSKYGNAYQTMANSDLRGCPCA